MPTKRTAAASAAEPKRARGSAKTSSACLANSAPRSAAEKAAEQAQAEAAAAAASGTPPRRGRETKGVRKSTVGSAPRSGSPTKPNAAAAARTRHVAKPLPYFVAMHTLEPVKPKQYGLERTIDLAYLVQHYLPTVKKIIDRVLDISP